MFYLGGFNARRIPVDDGVHVMVICVDYGLCTAHLVCCASIPLLPSSLTFIPFPFLTPSPFFYLSVCSSLCSFCVIADAGSARGFALRRICWGLVGCVGEWWTLGAGRCGGVVGWGFLGVGMEYWESGERDGRIGGSTSEVRTGVCESLSALHWEFTRGEYWATTREDWVGRTEMGWVSWRGRQVRRPSWGRALWIGRNWRGV